MQTQMTGTVYGQPRIWLGLEAAAMMCVAVAMYAMTGHSWVLFAVIFFLPDVSFLGYLVSARVGAFGYNIVHTYVTPIALCVVLDLLGKSLAIPLIWVAHIGFDRLMGYGLKYPDGFGFTHLGTLGVKKESVPAGQPPRDEL